MILSPLFRTSLHSERFVILKLCYIWSIDNVRDSGVADIIIGNSGLISSESNPRTSNMEAGGNKLELYFLNLNPPIVRSGGNDGIGEVLSIG